MTINSLITNEHVIDNFNEVILLTELDGTLLKVNKAAKKLFDSRHIINENIIDLFNKNVLEHNDSLILRWKNKQYKIYKIKLNDKLLLIMLRELALFVDEHTNLRVTDSIEELAMQKEEGMFVYNDNGIIDCDHSIIAMFDYDKKHLRTLKLDDLFIRKNKRLYGVKKSGELFPVDLIGEQDRRGEDFNIALVKNIESRIDYEMKIEQLAFYNDLTGLPNKHRFLTELQSALKQAEENKDYLELYYVNLNYFRAINETFGFDFGDEILKVCSCKLTDFAKEHNMYISHVHGNEFALYINHGDTYSKHLAGQLIDLFKNKIAIDDYEVDISISVGISIFPNDGLHAEELLNRAHTAMYVNHEKYQSNAHRFSRSVINRFNKQLMLKEDIHKALSLNEFELYYQPQFCLRKNKVIGVESLIRWRHPTKGIILPMDFIPFAEKTGLIIEIDHWVLYEACKQSVEWINHGYEPVKISVNISAKQFLKKDFVLYLKKIILKTGIDPHLLELEITEGAGITNEDKVLRLVKEVRDLGVSVAVDDFGTGYSSFKYLSLFPVNKVKIDKMFVQNEDAQNKMIVKSIIHLTHSLNMEVVAEGVETEEQIDFLKKLDCDQLQGYYFSKPVPARDIVGFFHKSV